MEKSFANRQWKGNECSATGNISHHLLNKFALTKFFWRLKTAKIMQSGWRSKMHSVNSSGYFIYGRFSGLQEETWVKCIEKPLQASFVLSCSYIDCNKWHSGSYICWIFNFIIYSLRYQPEKASIKTFYGHSKLIGLLFRSIIISNHARHYSKSSFSKHLRDAVGFEKSQIFVRLSSRDARMGFWDCLSRASKS